MFMIIFFFIFHCSPTNSINAKELSSQITANGYSPNKSSTNLGSLVCSKMKLPKNLTWIGCDREKLVNKISRGQEANPGEFPYIVSLKENRLFQAHFCGGAIIHPRWILTAKHCLEAYHFDVNRVLINLNTDNRRFPKKQIFASWVSSYSPEKKPKSEDKFNVFTDISLIRTKRAIKYKKVHPVKVITPKFTLKENISLVFAGWGSMAKGEESKDKGYLLKASAYLLPSKVCKDTFESGVYSKTSQLCVGRGRSVACPGDSGGPLVIQGKSPKEDIIVGITSYGVIDGCDRHEGPVVFTRIQHHIEWIKNVTKSFGDSIFAD